MKKVTTGLLFALVLATPRVAHAAVDPDTKAIVDSLWLLGTAFLVFWMNAGFALLESGLCQAKNTVNSLAKNFTVFAVSSVAFWAVGFAVMYGKGNDFIGLAGWTLRWPVQSPDVDVPVLVKFFFELAFAGIAATIVSGAVAERVKFAAFVIFSGLLVACIYPIGGHWVWGSGWLSKIGFTDFAGGAVVHSAGGWAALAGVIVLGPRLGKYLPDGRIRPVPAHNMTSATLGAFILWLGWFGLNAGRANVADPMAIARVLVNTNMAAAAGCLSAMLTAWLLLGKPDLSMILNGTLAGLVAISASCNVVSAASAMVIGLLAGALVIYGILFFDKIKLDDPVGALSVHLLNGVFGTLAVGLFAPEGGLLFGGGFTKTITQATGIVSIGVLAFALSLAAWFLLKVTVGVRVSPQQELDGLDGSEHGIEAYAGFVLARQEMGRDGF